LGVEWELAKREKELLWLRPSEAEPELTKSTEASIIGAPGQDTDSWHALIKANVRFVDLFPSAQVFGNFALRFP
jgi:hypothetical protein